MLRTSQNLIKKNSTLSYRVRTNELPVCWSLAASERDGDRLSSGHRAWWPRAAIKFIANSSIAKVFEVIPSSLWALLLHRLHSLLIICSVSGRMGNAGNSYCHLATISAAQCAFLFLAHRRNCPSLLRSPSHTHRWQFKESQRKTISAMATLVKWKHVHGHDLAANLVGCKH